jgi:hypothetical protein
MDSKNFAIGVLSITAVILFVGLLIVHTTPRPALAEGMTIVNGEYAIAVGSVTRNDEDLVYVIDAPAEQLRAYRFNAGAKQIELVDSIGLSIQRGPGGPATQPPKPPPKGKKP